MGAAIFIKLILIRLVFGECEEDKKKKQEEEEKEKKQRLAFSNLI